MSAVMVDTMPRTVGVWRVARTDVLVSVAVIASKMAFGKQLYEVEPLFGDGRCWVAEDSVTIASLDADAVTDMAACAVTVGIAA